MAYKFYSVKTNKTNMETAYILYMMLGSYFRKTICTTKRMEEKLYLRYQDMSEKKQMEREEYILKVLDAELSEEADRLEDLICEVRFQKEEGEIYTVTFYTGFENFKVFVDYKGHIKVWRESLDEKPQKKAC